MHYALETLFGGEVYDVVNELIFPLGRLARAEVVAPDGEGGLAAVADNRFRGVAVGQARFAVTRHLGAELVDEARREGGVERGGESVRRHQAVPAMLLRVSRAAILQIGPGELLAVVAEVDPIARANL